MVVFPTVIFSCTDAGEEWGERENQIWSRMKFFRWLCLRRDGDGIQGVCEGVLTILIMKFELSVKRSENVSKGNEHQK